MDMHCNCNVRLSVLSPVLTPATATTELLSMNTASHAFFVSTYTRTPETRFP